MNQKNISQTTVSAGEYLAPSVKVKEIRSRKMLCTSGGTVEEITRGDETDY